jgi:hypothetical protein
VAGIGGNSVDPERKLGVVAVRGKSRKEKASQPEAELSEFVGGKKLRVTARR